MCRVINNYSMCKDLILVIFVSTLLVSKIEGKSLPYHDCGKITSVPGDPRSLTPWTALIYFRISPENKFKFHTAGVILGPRTILSIAGGIFGDNFTLEATVRKYSIQEPHNVLVSAGLLSSDFNAVDSYSQFMKVRYIIPFTGHEKVNKEYHFLIYELERPLNLRTPYVKVLCINSSSPDPFQLSMVQSGFQGLSSEKNPQFRLRVFNITTRSELECEMEFNKLYKNSGVHVFCAKLKHTEACSLHGSTAVIQDATSRSFLAGLNVLIPSLRDDSCGETSTNFYSRFSKKTYSWLENNLKCSSMDTFSCGDQKCIPLSSLCNKVSECRNNSDEEDIFCRTQCGGNNCTLRFSESREKETTNINRVSSTSAPKIQIASVSVKKQALNAPSPVVNPIVYCSDLPVSGGVKVECESGDGEQINCTKAIAKSRATFYCERFYMSRYRFPSIEMTCGEDGIWSPFRAFVCDPDCGVLSSEYQPLLQDGIPTTRSSAFPWHAAIFRLSNGEYKYSCGASLVEKNLLITAAHCISALLEIPNSAKQFRIVLAPISSIYSSNLHDSISEIFEVNRAWIPPTFNQKILKSDIALVELTKPVNFGGFIRPVCYLWRFSSTTLQQIPSKGATGKVPGFGIDETGQQSSLLKFINLPVTSLVECLNASNGISSQSLFCGGGKNNTATVCSGDSGGGFVFPEKRGVHIRYTIRGVVSSAHLGNVHSCDPQKSAIFTHVDYFGDWIVDILEKIGMQ